MTDIRTSALKTPVDVAQYLFTRLHQMGVRSVHGVPGDYNLVALDYIDKTGLKWVGSVNELNAGKCSFLSRQFKTVPIARDPWIACAVIGRIQLLNLIK
jgi:hypothetical protein